MFSEPDSEEMTDSETSTEKSRRRAPLREELSSQFQQCVSSVKHYTGRYVSNQPNLNALNTSTIWLTIPFRFEDEAVRPAMTYYGGLYEQRPLFAVSRVTL